MKGDPGVDDERMDRWLASAHRGIVANLTMGFGDGGGFAEGHHPSRLSANSGFMGLLQAMGTAAGRDYITAARPNVQAITSRWIHLLMDVHGRPGFPHNGTYGADDYDTWGLSHGGEFATGFGTISPSLRPALLWTWQQLVAGRQFMDERSDWLKDGEDSFDVMTYPHRALYALVNWPDGETAQNPGDLLPRVSVDTVHGYIISRDRWQDADDSLITLAASAGPKGYYPFAKDSDHLRIWSRGIRTAFPASRWRDGQVTAFSSEPDGSFSCSVHHEHGQHHFVVDQSADQIVVVGWGPLADDMPCEQTETTSYRLRTVRFEQGAVLVIHQGDGPDISISCGVVQVGETSYQLPG
jgi:hypothetical protein